MKEEKQADVSIESLISRLYELKKDHMMPYNLGDMGEMGKIIDKLKAGYAAANQPASLEFTEWVYGNCSKVESGVHTGLWFIKFKKGDDEDAEDVYYTLPQLHKIFNPLAAANQPQKVVCKFSPFEHNKSIFNLGQCHSCFSKTVIEYPANQPQPHESIEGLQWRCKNCGREFNKRKPHACNPSWSTGKIKTFEKISGAAAKDGQADGKGSVFEVPLNKEKIEAGDVVIAKGGDDFGIVKEVRYNDADEVEVHWLNTKTRASRTSIYFLYRCYRFSNQDGQAERMFSLKEAFEIWEAGRQYGVDQVKEYHGALTFDRPDKQQYFKQTFNIDL